MTISGAWTRAARGAMLLAEDGTPGTTVFAEMSALAAATGAINLGQGFPDEDGPAEVLEAAREAISTGWNQYPPGRGTPELRSAIADHQARFHGIDVDPATEVLVTAGATEAIAATLLALVEEGDEVVTLEPFYDAYGALIALAQGVHRTVPLRAPDFQPDLDDLRSAVTDRTRVILLNDPHNPTGTVLRREARELIVELAIAHDAVIVTDEVYEHLVFDGSHEPTAALPGARERTVTISSGGKTFRTTGWKIGWLTAPAPLVSAILAVKQFLTFVNGAPFQPAIAVGLALPDEVFEGIADDLRAKRDILAAGLTAAGFRITLPAAGYFIVADAAPLGFPDARELCLRLPELAGVVAVPLSAFCREPLATEHASLVRFAFCKRTEVLEEAVRRLVRLADRTR
ncbi:putative N-succinyldiaminopimelate aminotransferase DapC [Clavibacter michiganensis]|uniref:Putative N-succinyldiaminopimelate aminotransferase DapC n=1 Tax=Clavibacter michiganensis TaxID=28447 RepID=A0A251YX67_9MICO|nr:pyridoxal phosphate-dependent aminotransferase [Clavibacter michiganensis]OUE28713.1 putative N-succinyldiaminopimelate aminotransferase DapC [Clavibacter michiganensis]